jgi:hypothetical protein
MSIPPGFCAGAKDKYFGYSVSFFRYRAFRSAFGEKYISCIEGKNGAYHDHLDSEPLGY